MDNHIPSHLQELYDEYQAEALQMYKYEMVDIYRTPNRHERRAAKAKYNKFNKRRKGR